MEFFLIFKSICVCVAIDGDLSSVKVSLLLVFLCFLVLFSLSFLSLFPYFLCNNNQDKN
jgi:hypothetical protein